MYMERTGTRAPGAKDRRGPVSKTIVEREIPPADAAAVLVRRAQAGDVHAFGELFRRYRTLVPALNRLSVSLRTTVILVAVQGLSHDEAAVVLGCSPGTIGWRMHEAKRKLHRLVARRTPRRTVPRPAGERVGLAGLALA